METTKTTRYINSLDNKLAEVKNSETQESPVRAWLFVLRSKKHVFLDYTFP